MQPGFDAALSSWAPFDIELAQADITVASRFGVASNGRGPRPHAGRVGPADIGRHLGASDLGLGAVPASSRGLPISIRFLRVSDGRPSGRWTCPTAASIAASRAPLRSASRTVEHRPDLVAVGQRPVHHR